MDAFHIRLKDPAYRAFFMELLTRMEFIEWTSVPETQHTIPVPSHSIFESAGMWADYQIDAKSLRTSAWKR